VPRAGGAVSLLLIAGQGSTGREAAAVASSLTGLDAFAIAGLGLLAVNSDGVDRAPGGFENAPAGIGARAAGIASLLLLAIAGRRSTGREIAAVASPFLVIDGPGVAAFETPEVNPGAAAKSVIGLWRAAANAAGAFALSICCASACSNWAKKPAAAFPPGDSGSAAGPEGWEGARPRKEDNTPFGSAPARPMRPCVLSAG
jgi:hypothetical protein